MADARVACRACGATGLEPWCEAGDAEYGTPTGRYAYLLCGDCGALSIDPCPVDRLAEIYPDSYYSYAGGGRGLAERVKLALDRRLLRSVLAPLAGARLAALDVGGGTGWMLDEARAVEPRLARTVVLDIDERARGAAEAAGHEFVARRVEEFTTGERFDLIVMLNLVEHVADPVGVLAAAGSMLRPGGRILVKTPNHDSLDARLFRHRYWGGLHCPRHWVIFTPDSFRRAAARAGLVVHELRLTQGAPFWAFSVLASLAAAGLARIGPGRPMVRHPLMPWLTVAFGALDLLRAPVSRTSQMFAILGRAEPAAP